MELKLNITGFDLTATFSDKEIEAVHLPLLQKIMKLATEKEGRFVVFLAAPPGTGKSTLVAFWEHLARISHLDTIQALPLDGFHYPNEYLESNSTIIEGKEVILKSIKGAYQTFDLSSICNHLERIEDKNLKWPLYDRNLHGPVLNAIDVKEKIVIIEGNWLLLKESGWCNLKEYADLTISIKTEPKYLKERLINRKMRSGLNRKEAEAFFENSDGVNVKKVLADSFEPDISLTMSEDGSLQCISKK